MKDFASQVADPTATGEQSKPSESPPTQTDTADNAERTLPNWVHGSFALRYRGRWADGEQDHDAAGVLALDVGDPAVNRLTGHLLARVDADLDGRTNDGPFQDLSDTYDHDVVAKLYLGYADLALDEHPEESPGTVRIGRQSDPRLPEVLRFDGVSYFSRPLGKDEVEFGLYGGVPAHLYESDDGDRTFGSYVEGAFWTGGRARLDWMHLEDEDVLGTERDDLFTLGVWQQLPTHWRFEGEYSHLENDPRDLRLRAFYTSDNAETIVRMGYYELLETQTTRVTELDSFVEQLLDYEPFRETNLNVSHAFGENTVVDAGFDLRRVSHSSDVGEFNRDWERYYVTTTFSNVATDGLALSVTADRWDDDSRDTGTLGADLSYDANEHWTAAVGTYFSLYKYHFLELDERDDVRTYYVRASRELTKSSTFDVVYEYEDDDLESYNTLRLGAVWHF